MESILKWNNIIFYVQKQNNNFLYKYCFLLCTHILLFNSYLIMENIQKLNNMAFMYGIYLTS
jgi:hypothetical protein